MNIAFARRKLEKTFNSQTALKKAFGDRMARIVAMRMAVLRHARTLSMVPVTRPERRHLLEGNRAGQYAVDLVHPKRLVFEPNHDPVPRKEDGGINTDQVTAITIVEVIDYH
jgi:proteic killer suppression protein